MILMDSIGCALVATQTDKGKINLSLAKRFGGPPEASVIGSGYKVALSTATMVNGELMFTPDYISMIAGGNEPSYVLPAILAMAESTGASGKELILSTAIGLEISTRLARATLRQTIDPNDPKPTQVLHKLKRHGNAYSNFGAALAGYIVEQVVGMSFERYVEENIFKPLGMYHSTFRQPVPSDLASDLAIGYSYTNGRFVAGEINFVHDAPAATMCTTATDLAKFMIAHLQGGRYKGVHILQEDTVKEMHQQQFTNDPRVNGWTYGFAEATDNNQRIITHEGIYDEFYSYLILLPEHELGVFVSYNSYGGIPARFELMKVFLDRYFPVEKLPVPQPISKTLLFLNEKNGFNSIN